MNQSTQDNLISPEQIETFHKQGFVKVERLISEDEVTELVSEYDKVLSGELPVPDWGDDHVQGQMVQLASPSQHVPGWQTHAYFLRANAIARQLIGEHAVYQYDQLIYKPAHYPAETHWHQDAGYWQSSRGSDNAVTCWLALSPAYKENGGMQFIPDSHHKIFDHVSISHRSEINGALETRVNAKDAVAVSLNPGDATFHHCRTPHFAGGNFTDIPRKGLITHFWSSD